MMFLVFGALAGVLMLLVGSLMFLIAAFGVSIWWGIFCILFPPVNLLFLLVNWKAAKKPFFVIAIGFLLVLLPLILVENFLTSMRSNSTMHFRSFHQFHSVTTAPAITVAPGPDGKSGVVDPQSAAGLPELPEKEK